MPSGYRLRTKIVKIPYAIATREIEEIYVRESFMEYLSIWQKQFLLLNPRTDLIFDINALRKVHGAEIYRDEYCVRRNRYCI